MSKTLSTRPLADVASIARSAREASRKLALLSGETRNAALLTIADALEGNGGWVLAANAKDCAAAETLASTGEMTPAMLSRLRIKESGIAEMAARIREVANLPDPLGKRLAATELDQGLILHKESCALGVIAVVFESRPDVVPQVASPSGERRFAGFPMYLRSPSNYCNLVRMCWNSCVSGVKSIC